MLQKIIYFLIPAFIGALLVSCSSDTSKDVSPVTTTSGTSLTPANFLVEIPGALVSTKKSGAKVEAGDTLSGKDIYEPLRGYINVGYESAKLVNTIIKAIALYNLDKPMLITFVGTNADDDGREKKIEVVENGVYEGVSYAYKLTFSDIKANKVGMQVYWNNNPVKGVAILNFYQLNRKTSPLKDTSVMYRVDYSEDPATNAGYDKTMLVQVHGIYSSNTSDPNALKMFAGRKGDIVEVYGNSNHPNVDDGKGFVLGNINYAFRARGNTLDNYAVAEVCLPPSTVTSTASMFTNYSVKTVLGTLAKAAVKKAYNITLTDAQLEPYLKNSNPPGFFISDEFKSAGTVPAGQESKFTTAFVDLSSMSPYVPKEVRDLKVMFGN